MAARIVVTEFVSLDGVMEAPGGEPGSAVKRGPNTHRQASHGRREADRPPQRSGPGYGG
jgi:hypothetical protein